MNYHSSTGRINPLRGNENIAKILGYAGLIPFVVFSIGSWISLPTVSDATPILIAYAAVILSFMGAVHWGFIMARSDGQYSIHLIASVIPALVAWVALLTPVMSGLALLLSGFITLIIYDWSVDKKLGFPDWYVPMRIKLTLVVMLCLVTTLMAVGLN